MYATEKKGTAISDIQVLELLHGLQGLQTHHEDYDIADENECEIFMQGFHAAFEVQFFQIKFYLI